MMAGRMRSRLRLMRPETERDRFGSEKTVWTPVGTVWAERVRLTGRRREELGEHFPDYSAEFNIRDAHDVDDNWRVEELGGHLYTVTNTVPNRGRGMLTLVCERVNR